MQIVYDLIRVFLNLKYLFVSIKGEIKMQKNRKTLLFIMIMGLSFIMLGYIYNTRTLANEETSDPATTEEISLLNETNTETTSESEETQNIDGQPDSSGDINVDELSDHDKQVIIEAAKQQEEAKKTYLERIEELDMQWKCALAFIVSFVISFIISFCTTIYKVRKKYKNGELTLNDLRNGNFKNKL